MALKFIGEVSFLAKLAVFFLILGVVLGLAIVSGSYPVETAPGVRPTASASLCQRSY
jgi:hypothetical protein